MKGKNGVFKSLCYLLVFAICFTLIGCGGNKQGSDSSSSKNEIVIGCVGAMTGPSAQLGLNLKTGVETAVEEINASGGINGMQVRAIFLDDEADPTKSLNLTRQLVTKDKIDAFIGPTNTTCAKAIQPYLNQNKIIQMNGGCTGTALIDINQYPYSFRTHFPDKDQAIFMVRRAVEAGYKKIAMVHDTSALGVGAKADMEECFKELGVTPVADCSYNSGDVDMLPVAQKIKNSQADCALFFTLAVDGARIMKALTQIDYAPPKLTVHGYTCVGQGAFRELAGSSAEGVLCNSPEYASYPAGGDPPAKTVEIAKKFQEKYGPNILDELIYGTALSYYDCTYLLKTGIENAGSVDSDKIKAGIESIKDFEGAYAKISYAPDKHEGTTWKNIKACYVTKIKYGCFEQVK